MTKIQLKKRLTDHYGTEAWKTDLARDLEVDVSTVRRWFNSSRPLRKAVQLQILYTLDMKRKRP